MNNLITHTYLDILGFEFEVEIEVAVTSYGEVNRYSPNAVSPPDPPEFYITSIRMRVDRPNNDMGPWWEVDPGSAQFSYLEEHYRIQAAALDIVISRGAERYWRKRARSRVY